MTRDDMTDERAPLFSADLRRLTRESLLNLVGRLGVSAHIKNAQPPRLRQTFAIAYLRCGGDLFTLQRLLGHSSLDRVQYCARLTQVNLEQAHRRASPADNWRYRSWTCLSSCEAQGLPRPTVNT